MKEIELFFEYEKQDILEEFVLNFEPFIEGFKDKNQVVIYLTKLFRKEIDELQKDKRQELDKQNITDLSKQIRKIKKIVNYLKTQIVVEETDFKKSHESYSKHKDSSNNQSKKKKRSKMKEKEEFSLEVVELGKILIHEGDISSYLENHPIYLEMVNDTLKYFKINTQQLIHKKIELRNKGEYDLLDDIQKEINSYKKIVEKLIQYKNKQNNEYSEENQTKRNPIRRDHFINDQELEMLLQQLEIAEDKTAVLSNIIKFYQTKLHEEKEKQKILLNKKEELFSSFAEMDEEYVKQIKNDYFSEVRQTISNIKRLRKGYNHYFNIMKKANNEFLNPIEIDSSQEMIEEKMVNREDIHVFDIGDVLYAFGHYIKYQDVLDHSLLDYSKEIMNYFATEEIKNDVVVNGIYYVWDAIKYRLSNTPKEELEKRKLLKDIRILFDFVIKNYKEKEDVVKHDYLFNVVDYFLVSEDYFIYLKKLVEQMPSIVNTRHIRSDDKTSEHIIIYIVDQFIKNYRKMLKDKSQSYVNKDYLREVYFLFTRCPYMYLAESEKKLIDYQLGSFMTEVNKNLTSSRRKEAVKRDLKEMYTDKFYFDRKRENLQIVDECKLEGQMNYFSIALQNAISDPSRVDLTNECAITLGSGYHAYSLKQEKDQTILKIHVIDLYPLIVSYSTLDRYLFNQTLTKEPIDDIILHNISMARNQVYPTITYEFVFDEKGNYKNGNDRIDHFRVYDSKIQIKKNYFDFNLIYDNGDIVLKSYRDLYRKSLIKNHLAYDKNYTIVDMDSYFEKILNQGVTEYFEAHQLPFIYSGVRFRDEKEYIDIMNNIGPILSRLDTNKFNMVYSLLSNDVEEFFYSMRPFIGEYQLSIKDPLNYSGILIQRVLHELVLHNKYSEEEYQSIVDKFSKRFEEVVMYMNFANDYVDQEVLKSQKGKIMKLKKQLF